MAAHEKLAPIHSAILIYMIQSGVMVFVLPQRLAQTFGTNGWIAVAGFGLIVTLNIALIGLVYKLGGGRTIFEILEQSIPKPILFPFYAAIAVIWMMLGSMAGKEYILIFQMFSFPTTHSMLFYFALVTLVAWLLTKGIYNIAKAATLFFGMFIWMIFLLFFFWGEFEWGRLTPFLFKGGEFSLSEQFDMYSSFLGFELCLLLFGYVDRQTKLIGGAIWANGILTWNYLYAALMAFGIYSLQQLKSKMFPIIDILAYVRLPFIERVDNLFFGFLFFRFCFRC
ncbi:GerAB/ArcD/ProY family transporter [Paenibacillus thailandensis]|uniref:GerAB/ArcD/ProY family transporter n=1 Tax=Paenibacillus thailandensis TaxID=393250 RepID=UPI003635A2A2